MLRHAQLLVVPPELHALSPECHLPSFKARFRAYLPRSQVPWALHCKAVLFLCSILVVLLTIHPAGCDVCRPLVEPLLAQTRRSLYHRTRSWDKVDSAQNMKAGGTGVADAGLSWPHTLAAESLANPRPPEPQSPSGPVGMLVALFLQEHGQAEPVEMCLDVLPGGRLQ